ncbi:hypothetical protein HSB1_44800 [Halogranum salarium B-1]|uniref:Uncharacterized protein n=1 Tax=Halogranum salarium B-1 TaxID=1210908 RepID=J3JD15_9EURY|nr:hypothetical protein HSB1_44800 [Halogranum salarium B-1]
MGFVTVDERATRPSGGYVPVELPELPELPDPRDSRTLVPSRSKSQFGQQRTDS